jgi:putative transposase
MPRRQRVCPPGQAFHVLNRAVARLTLFEKPEDYDAFVRVVSETWELVPLPILAMTVMPNHWHFVVRPSKPGQVSEFFRRLSVTHCMRWHAHYHTGGTGHLYQGRFKSFPVQSDEHLLMVMRYVERNPLRAGLVEAAEDWRWSSAWARRQADESARRWLSAPSDPSLPRTWRAWVSRPQSEAEIEAVRSCIRRGSPFGDTKWVRQSAARLSLQSTLRPRGRPKNET